ncbi:uncharacterized protein LOC111643370 [Copidosoma floridanum]|uniref:uncharacterized protein LOC111643370 n=1 Tax=Copidosoma floridanum TaxID=29053 RepID=UPI000C6F4FF4|nr:uncharacterized protein LOC111643370 [Copidosoma floridanum]
MENSDTNKIMNYFIYAKDYSISTDGEEYYHENGLKTFEQFKSDVEQMKQKLVGFKDSPVESKIIYLHWGYDCKEVDEWKIRTTYLQKMDLSPSTDPRTIIYWLKKNCNIDDKKSKIRLLYIITDGMVNSDSVDECFELNQYMHYETVVFHAFHQNLEDIDLSVASSFFKDRCMVYCNNKLYDSIAIGDNFEYDKINIDNFASEQNNLTSYIKLKFLKKFQNNANALEEIEKLKKLRSRLFDELSLKTEQKCKVNLETKDRNVFIREFTRTDWYKSLRTSIQVARIDVEKAITAMINYIVSEKKTYSFDALKFDMKFEKPVEEEPMVDVNFTDEQKIEFPDIILDDDKGIPVVILTELDLLKKIIFHDTYSNNVQPASFSKFKSTMECPLFLVNDKDISESIGYFYTYDVYKQFLAHDKKTEPRTRKPFHGGLVLIDTNQFDKYNDYILSATYFNSKKIHFNIGLFYYVLWKNCQSKEWMDINVAEQFKKYAMRRISETVCKIGLSSLPLDPQEKTSLLTALWYCVDLSSCIFKADLQYFNHERLRMFYGVAHCMMEILKYFDYDLDIKSIERRREIMSEVMTLKRIPKRGEKVYYLLKKIFKTVDGFLVSEIEKPFNLYKLNYLKFEHKNMLDDNVIEETVHLNDFVHLMYFEDNLEVSEASRQKIFEICEKTFRPFFAIDRNKSFYTELVEVTKKVVINNDNDEDKVKVSIEPIDSLEFDRILSLYHLYIHCVEDLEKYPTLPEYVEYISKKKKFRDDLVTIFPSNVYLAIKHVYGHYQKVVSKVGTKEFLEVCKSCISRTERVKVEGKVKFNSDDEIYKFISTEELKKY